MDCPNCGEKSKVYKTLPKGQTVYRYHECLDCGLRYRTREILDAILNGHQNNTIEALTKWGVQEEMAHRLAGKYQAKIIKLYSDNLFALIFDYESQNGRQVSSRAGFLVWCIENKYPIPVPQAKQNGHHGSETIFISETDEDPYF